MRVQERKGWKAMDKNFARWYRDNGHPEWGKQKQWLSKELVKRSFIEEDRLLDMWAIFNTLTGDCSSWKVQSKILSLITLCMNENIGEDLDEFIK